MTAPVRLIPHAVEKPWGQDSIPAPFDRLTSPGQRIGEIWFDHPDAEMARTLPLLVKYLFTSERLSVQVHPDDAAARGSGHARGKEEAWVVLSAEPDARLGLGLREPLDAAAMRAAIDDGTLADRIDWRVVHPGEHYHLPPGTVHAIGAGLSLVEVQQNIDLTYRLFDYGRPRELHIDAGMAVSHREPYAVVNARTPLGDGVTQLTRADSFTMVEVDGDLSGARAHLAGSPLWFAPLSGAGTVGDVAWTPGECWLVPDAASIAGAGRAIVAWAT